MIHRLLLMICLLGLSPVVNGQNVISPAGTYSFVTPTAVTITYGPNSLTFTWNVAPNPTPIPTPDPTPPPVSVIPVLTGDVWALVVYEDGKPIPSATTGPSVAAAVIVNKINLIQSKSNDPSISTYSTDFKSVGVPAILFIQRTPTNVGKCVYKTALPSNEADLIILLNKIRGK